MYRAIIRSVALTTNYAALSSVSEVATVTLIADGDDNGAPLLLLGDDGLTAVTLPTDIPVTLRRVDLSTIKVKIAAGTGKVSLIGGTW